MFKVELLDSNEGVVGFFGVVFNTPIASLPAMVREALKVSGQSAMYWQVKRPDGLPLCRKVRIGK